MEINNLIDLNLTQSSGQTSQPPWFKKENNEYLDIINIDSIPVLIKASQKDINSLNIDYELPIGIEENINKKKLINEINRIYDLNFDLNNFYTLLETDFQLKDATIFCEGLRLFQAKNPFECIISSISSANNSIKRWTNSINTIKYKWGEKITFPSGDFHTFPKPEILSNVYLDNENESEIENKDIELCNNNLKACGVGYRNKYIKKASKLFIQDIDINKIYKMTYEEAFETIIQVPGVGPKVADCILLYGFNFQEAFPSDVWIKRIISYLYFNQKEISAEKARNYGMECFGEYAGYVQLYLFHYARKSGLMEKLKNK